MRSFYIRFTLNKHMFIYVFNLNLNQQLAGIKFIN